MNFDESDPFDDDRGFWLILVIHYCVIVPLSWFTGKR